MGLFSGKDPMRHFEGTGFTITRTLFSPPVLSMLPAVYVDDDARRWAVRLPGSEPRILSFAAIESAEVVEDTGAADKRALEQAGHDRFAKTLMNPNAVSKANAAGKDKICFGLGVVVIMKDAVTPLQITFIAKPTRKNSTAYTQLYVAANGLKRDFDAMADRG